MFGRKKGGSDTVKLLRECHSGVEMGMDAIRYALPKTENSGLKEVLEEQKNAHDKIGQELKKALKEKKETEKENSSVLKGMAYMKIRVSSFFHPGDKKMADVMTDGCHMGIKTLSSYLNQYPKAEKEAKQVAEKLIHLEEDMAKSLRPYL